MTNFEQVKALVDQNKIKIISILSPARTMSTVLGESISGHPEISAQILQPYHLPYPLAGDVTDAQREEIAYGVILKAYEAIEVKPADRPVKIVVKEMTKSLMNPEALKRWDAVSEKHIITVRNPLLSLESYTRYFFGWIEKRPEGLEQTARAFAKQHHQQFTQEYLRKFPDLYAQSLGVQEVEGQEGQGRYWEALAKQVMGSSVKKGTRDYSVLEPLMGEFTPFIELNLRLSGTKKGYVEHLTESDAKKAGYESLDYFAQQNGYKNWKLLVKQELHDKGDMKVFSPLLESVEATSFYGWEALKNILTDFKAPRFQSRAKIVDGSILRADPPFIANALCDYCDLDRLHADAMVNWEGVPSKMYIEHIELTHRMLFGRARISTSLSLPEDSPIPLSHIPSQLRRHFIETALPAYINALSDDRCIRPRGKAELTAILNKKARDGGMLKDIDPVWAYSLISTDKTLPNTEKEGLLENIRERHRESWGETFVMIDRINKSASKTRILPREKYTPRNPAKTTGIERH